MTEILETIPGIDAVHEPKPLFSDAARLAQFVPEAAVKFWREVKLPAIARYKEDTYFETSHVFINGFPGALLEMGIIPDLVVLTRPHREVALSRWRRGSVPARTERGCQYTIHPNARGNLLSANGWEKWTDYQLCYWFCLEVAARSEHYVQKFAGEGATIHRTSLGKITTETGFMALIEALGLPKPDMAAYHARKDTPSNVTDDYSRQRFPDGDLDEMEAEVEEAVQQLKLSKKSNKTSIHIFLVNTGSVREELSVWREKWRMDGRYSVWVEGARGFPVTDNRGRCVLKFLAGGADYMVMVDDDVVPQRNILDLVEYDLDIVVFPTPVWRPTQAPQSPMLLNVTLLDEAGELIEGEMLMGDAEDLHPISSGGTGCMMIARRVLEHPDMFHAFQDLWRFDGTRSIGNDIWFVRRATAAGFKAYAAMKYPCSHFKELDLLHVHMVYDELRKTTCRGQRRVGPIS